MSNWSQNVVDIARYSTCVDPNEEHSEIKKKAFRKRAHKRADVLAELHKEVNGNGKGKFRYPNGDEAYFIQEWMRTHEGEYLDADGKLDDAKLVEVIRRHVVCPGDELVHTMTG